MPEQKVIQINSPSHQIKEGKLVIDNWKSLFCLPQCTALPLTPPLSFTADSSVEFTSLYSNPGWTTPLIFVIPFSSDSYSARLASLVTWAT